MSEICSWYEIKNVAGDVAEIYLFDEIGSSGVSAAQFIQELRSVKSRTINLHVNSPGGDVFDGIAIYNALQRHPAAVNVVVDGLAASSASVVAQAGDRIVMSKGGTMMIHEPYGMAVGNAQTMDKLSAMLGKVGDTIAGIYAGRAGGTEAEWRQRMRDETWYRAQEAVDAGLADEVGAAAPKTLAVFNLADFKHVPDWLVERKPTGAGRTMSQSNLDRLHGAIEGLNTVHDAACDMGDGCPRLQGRVPAIRNAEWDTAYINDLPDSAFAYIAPGGEKDTEGKTKPRSLRYLPHHGADGAVDIPHLRNALSRVSQTNIPADAKASATRHLDAHAKQEGVGRAAA